MVHKAKDQIWGFKMAYQRHLRNRHVGVQKMNNTGKPKLVGLWGGGRGGGGVPMALECICMNKQ